MDYIAVGKIMQPFGLGGYLKVFAYAELPDRFLSLKTVYVKNRDGFYGYLVEDALIQSGTVQLKLRGIDDRNAAQAMTKTEVWVPDDQRVELPAKTYFIHDLIGLKVYDSEGAFLGELTSVYQNAGNDIYEIRLNDREILIPAVSEFIKDVNLEEKRISVQLIEGMLP